MIMYKKLHHNQTPLNKHNAFDLVSILCFNKYGHGLSTMVSTVTMVTRHLYKILGLLQTFMWLVGQSPLHPTGLIL